MLHFSFQFPAFSNYRFTCLRIPCRNFGLPCSAKDASFVRKAVDYNNTEGFVCGDPALGIWYSDARNPTGGRQTNSFQCNKCNKYLFISEEEEGRNGNTGKELCTIEECFELLKEWRPNNGNVNLCADRVVVRLPDQDGFNSLAFLTHLGVKNDPKLPKGYATVPNYHFKGGSFEIYCFPGLKTATSSFYH